MGDNSLNSCYPTSRYNPEVAMNKNNLAKIAMIIGGLIELGIALGHFIMQRFILSSPEFSGLPKIHLDFVIHAAIAVGFCMLIFGFLAFYFSNKITEKSARVFSLSQAVLWTIRLISEFIYPIKVPMFGINNMSNLIVVGVVFIIAAFLVPTIFFERK